MGVNLDPKALMKFHLVVDSIILRDGRLVFPLGKTNEPPRTIVVDNIQTFLRFLPDDEWALENFRANFANARIRLIGNVKHGSAVRRWTSLKPQEPAAAGDAWREKLRKVSDVLEQTLLRATRFRADLRGDARIRASRD
jgi:hypothetical protein